MPVETRSRAREFVRPVTRSVLVLAMLVAACVDGETQFAVSSIYTDLMGSNCGQVSENRETGATVHRCDGVVGWNLLVLYDDQRMSVTVVAPDGRQSPLAYWDTVSSGFTSLGPRAEWRVRKNGNQTTPVALIVRVNASEAKAAGERTRTSYLAVAKISGSTACVTRRIEPSSDANEQARRSADNESQTSCLGARTP
jgi:hypothetical protein